MKRGTKVRENWSGIVGTVVGDSAHEGWVLVEWPSGVTRACRTSWLVVVEEPPFRGYPQHVKDAMGVQP
jgi:hypothetical protein